MRCTCFLSGSDFSAVTLCSKTTHLQCIRSGLALQTGLSRCDYICSSCSKGLAELAYPAFAAL